MCGIIGMFSDKDVTKPLFYGLSSLQHRGQESAGLSIGNGQEIIRKKGMGLVTDVFTPSILEEWKGNVGIGHVRYSTSGGSYEYNSQPLMAFARGETLSLAHNGNLINYQILRTRLEEEGMMFQTTIDSEVILYLISRYYHGDIVDAIRKTMDLIEGAYAIVLILKDTLVAFRDPYGIRPLVLGKKPGEGTIVSSESSSVEIMGGQVLRDIHPGEIVVIDKSGQQSYQYKHEQKTPKHCVFEYVYFARNDATLDGVNAYMFRRRCGEILYDEAPANVDLVIPVPDSGIPSAIGYSQRSKIPLAEGLVKNRYMGRTFIKPSQEEREMAVKLKLNPLTHVVIDKKIVLVDDSIVRGTTSANLIRRLRDAGAKEVHMRITSPPVINPCYYGIDTPQRSKLIAANYSIEEIQKKIGADSLAFISLEGLDKATRIQGEHLCKACFDGVYPVDPIVL
ncbi:MAG: amidophosphoribosyltransferase [Tissierellia bacterium]|nr:amidophosphoribosyltransferase [Tissierellia bacterium]